MMSLNGNGVFAAGVTGVCGALIRGPAVITSAYAALLAGRAFVMVAGKVFQAGLSTLTSAAQTAEPKNNEKAVVNSNVFTKFIEMPQIGKKDATIQELLISSVAYGVIGFIALEASKVLFGPMPQAYRLIAGVFGFDFVQGSRLDHLNNLYS